MCKLLSRLLSTISILIAIPAVADEPVKTSSADAVVEAAPTETGPEATFQQFMAAMREGDFEAFSKLMHPEALATFHETFSGLAELDDSGEALGTFFGVESFEELEALSPEESFESLMKALTEMTSGMKAMFETARAKVLGSVPEGDTIHVVYRMTMNIEGTSISKIAVAPFKKNGDEWRALLTGDMEGIIQAIQAQSGG